LKQHWIKSMEKIELGPSIRYSILNSAQYSVGELIRNSGWSSVWYLIHQSVWVSTVTVIRGLIARVIRDERED